VVACLLLLFNAYGVSAQEATDGSETARFRVGVLRFTPSIAVSNVGIDNNVFNEVEDPKRDTTAAVGPAAAFWLRLGRARLSGKTSGQYLYFKEYDNQRSWNTDNQARLELPLARITPFLTGAYTNSRDRPGFEIDSRARRHDQTVTGGLDVRLTGKTRFSVTGGQSKLTYAKDATFLGTALADTLDRTTTTEQLQLRSTLTPLTTFVFTSEAIQDRFAVAEDRNADSIRVLAGFELKPFALISGKAAVGFRHFNILSDRTPDYNGVVAAIDARYVLVATQIQAKVNRDITYSFETSEPYYALTDLALTITQRITTAWDVVGRGGRQWLAYRSTAASAATGGRTDRGDVFGAGIGYRLGETIRIGLDANHYRRRSEAFTERDYQGLRFGASVSYGLPQ
jgi:hypothetical protein